MSYITGGGYMSTGVDHSENVRLCMRLGDRDDNTKIKYDRDKSKSFSISVPLTPYAHRSTNGFIGSGPFLPQKAVGIPSYCSMKDPCLEEYYCRKFSRMLSPQLPLRDIYHSSIDADRLGLRSNQFRSSNYLTQKTEALYKVAVTTADVKGAGTSISVFISIRGDRANLPRTKLKKPSKSNKKTVSFKFTPGSTQIFPIKCPDLGELESVLVEHDGLEPKDSWLLQGIEIMNTENKKIWLFTCNHWLSLYKEDGKVSRELFAFRSMRTKYEIVVLTGDVPEGDTDSRVYLTLCGRTGISPQILLAKENKNCFQRAQSSRFVVAATCVGPITKVRIRQDESGSKPNWYLERICVTDLKHPQWRYFFQCKNWLSSSKGDGATMREIRGTKEITGIATRTEYKISLYTANKPGAGTKAEIFLQIFGENGESDIIFIKNPEGIKDGSITEHIAPMKQLGALKQIRIGHNNKGPQPRWLLEKVIINDIEMSRVFEFPCAMWFSDLEGEKLIRLLKIKETSLGSQKYKYEIQVTTGNRSKAGTTSQVYLILSGPEPKDKRKDKIESSGRILLQGAKFEKGRTDLVVVDLGHVLSPLTQLSAGITPKGNKPDWFLEDVIIFCPKTGIEQSFICGNWLSASREGCTQEVLLVEDVSKRKTKGSKDAWVINIHTSDIKDAGTNANVTMVLYGSEGKTDDVVLPSDKKIERNSTLEFGTDLIKVGLPYKLRVQHDNSGSNPSWHLNKIQMTNVPTGDVYQFICDRWLSDSHEDHTTVREIPAIGPGIKKEAPVCKYKVQIFTGNKMYAGTDANVFINVYGDKGDLGDRFLTHSNNKHKFTKNQMDEFVLEAVKLGKINKIKLGHDSKLPGSGWFVDKVVVWEEEDPSNTMTFRCNCWFDSAEGDGLTVRELTGSAMLGKTTYEVIVKTGTENGAGTDANVYIRLFGSIGDTGKVQLKTSSANKNKFENGATDVFKLEAEDIGEIKSMRLSHDDTGANSAWLVDQVVVVVPTLGLKYVFLLNKWLDKDMLEVDADPSNVDKIDKTIQYQVTVFTGKVLNAGTSAKVFLQIYGKDKKTEETILKSRSETFQKGNEDLFKINAADVGAIQKIRIGHDGKKPGAGWFLDKVLIERIARPKEDMKEQKKIKKKKKPSSYDDDMSNSDLGRFSDSSSDDLASSRKSLVIRQNYDKEEIEKYWFFANRWFATDEDDGMIVRELIAMDEDGRPLSDLQEFEYKVAIKTGNESGAGTDANVFIIIYGHKSDSGERALKKPTNSTINKFEKNSLDTFIIKAIELGKLEKIKIRHDNIGGGAAWFLDYVLINDDFNEYLFPCYSWLAKNEGDGLISRNIFVANPEVHNDWKNNQLSKDKFKIYQEDQQEKYEVNVYTTKKSFAGTDANVYLVLYGEKNDSGVIPLKKSLTHSNKFESGNCDKFIIKAADIGELKKIKIGHDNSGAGADWHLEKVEIEAFKLGGKWVFPCNDWIAKSKGDGKLERELYPQSQLTMYKRPRVTYEVTTHTSDLSGADTKANVYIQIYGRKDSTEQRFLANDIDRAEKFKKGAIDTFYLEMEDVEDPIEKIRIGHDGKGVGAKWHLNKVIVKRLLADKSKSVAYQFPCNRWLSRNEDDHAIERELIADQIIRKKFSIKEGKSIETIDDNISLHHMKKYLIRIYTGDDTGTNAKVFLKLIGENGDTGERQLVDSKTHRDQFQKNNMDEFEWEAVDLGNIYKLDIRHDNSGLFKKDWFLKKVEVIDSYDNETYVFQCERWLSRTKEDKKIKRTLYAHGYEGERSPSSSRSRMTGSIGSLDSASLDSKSGTYTFENDEDVTDGKAEIIPYTITVKTGPDKNMGSSGPFWVRLYGSKDLKTKRIRLQKIGSDYFAPDSKETISVESIDVQNITQIEVANEGVDEKSSWYLNSISVGMPTKGKSYHVPCGTWLSKFHGERKTSRIFNVVDKMITKFTPKITYDLTIYTGDCENAGTDSSLFIQLFGNRGESSIYPLEKMEDNFERSHRDHIKMEMEDVGVITRIKIQNDGKGVRPHWFLEKIDITNEKTMEMVECVYNEYLSKQLGKKKLLSVDLVPGSNAKKSSYRVFVKTSNIKSANTSADVFIKLYGEFGDSGELSLIKAEKPGKLFQVDKLDEFVFNDLLSLGDLNRCQVWHNKAGFSSSWHLEYIEVREMNSRRVWKFPCNKWLSQSEDDKQIFRELICDSSPDVGKKVSKETIYEVTVTTGDKKNAGMPDDLWIIFHGTKDYSDDCLMQNSTKNKLFSKGNVDQMKYKSNNLGDLKEIIIGAVKNPKSDVHRSRWYCHEIQVKDLTTLKTYVFEVRDWIEIEDHMEKKNGRLLMPARVEIDPAVAKGAEIRKKGVVKYEVIVTTGKAMGSGTNANIFLTIYGDGIDSGKRPLIQKGRDLFERGQEDKFIVESADLGDIQKVKIEHDDTGLRSDWMLDKMKVTNLSNHKSWMFECGEWLSKDKGDQKLWKILMPS